MKIKIEHIVAVQRDNLIKEFSFFLMLKKFNRESRLKNFDKNLSVYADSIGMSCSTLRRRIKTLVKLNWVHYAYDKHTKENTTLVLVSANKLDEYLNPTVEKFNKNYRTKKTISSFDLDVKTESLEDIISFIELSIISLKINQCDYIVRKKKSFYNVVEKSKDKEKRLHLLNYRFPSYKEMNKILKKTRRESSLRDDLLLNIFLIESIASTKTESASYTALNCSQRLYKQLNSKVTLSRQGIAKLFNKKSKSSGSRIVEKLKSKNLLKDTQDCVFVTKLPTLEQFHYLFDGKENYFYIEHNGEYFIYFKLCNQVSLNNDNTFSKHHFDFNFYFDYTIQNKYLKLKTLFTGKKLKVEFLKDFAKIFTQYYDSKYEADVLIKSYFEFVRFANSKDHTIDKNVDFAYTYRFFLFFEQKFAEIRSAY